MHSCSETPPVRRSPKDDGVSATLSALSTLLGSRDEVAFDPDPDPDSDFDGWWISLREIQWLRWDVERPKCESDYGSAGPR